MRLERRRGTTQRMNEVERAHEELTGTFKPFWEIAVELYDKFGSQRLVRDAIETRFSVSVSEKTASLWINRGMDERKAMAA
jgi:hypothetical protein